MRKNFDDINKNSGGKSTNATGGVGVKKEE